MKLTGSYKINLEKQKVWDALNDPEILKQAILDVKNLIKNLILNFLQKLQIKLDLLMLHFLVI